MSLLAGSLGSLAEIGRELAGQVLLTLDRRIMPLIHYLAFGIILIICVANRQVLTT